MKKLSLVVATMLISHTSTFAEEIENDWTLNGNIRAAFISDSNDIKDSNEMHDLAVGGSINILTPEIKGFKVGSTFYTSQPLFGQKTDAWLTEQDNGSYSYIGEAYITGNIFGKTSVILGRKVIDTPFANSDDIGMAPNSFEVYLVQNRDLENFVFTAGRVTKWAGHDAPTRGSFTDLTGGDGVSVTAVNYADTDLGVEAQAWYYHLDNFKANIDVGISYVDATYSIDIDDQTSLSASGQFARYQHINGDENDGSVIGLSAEASYDSLTVGIAYNQADGDIAPLDGFGGGPFYTSGDLLTISTSGKDSSALAFTTCYSLNDQVSFSAGYIGFTPKKGSEIYEFDFGTSYSFDDNLAIDLYIESWTQQNSSNSDKTDQYFEYSVFANYSF